MAHPAEVVEHDVPDAELIKRVRAGDDRAYELLFQRYQAAARRTATALTHSSVEADDIVAEAFAQILSALRHDRGPEEAFGPYLQTCVRNACRGGRRARAMRSEPMDPACFDDHAPATHDEPTNGTERELITSAFVSLPERWRQVLWATEVEGRGAAEVSEQLGIAPAAVSALAYRARKALAESYLKAHVRRAPPAAACRGAVDSLPGYVRRTCSASERSRVERHLAECSRCRDAEAHLRDMNRSLRSILLPLTGSAALGVSVRNGRRGIRWFRRAVMTKVVTTSGTASVVTILAVPVLLGVTLHSSAAEPDPTPPAPVVAEAASPTPELGSDRGTGNSSAGRANDDSTTAGGPGELGGQAPAPEEVPPAGPTGAQLSATIGEPVPEPAVELALRDLPPSLPVLTLAELVLPRLDVELTVPELAVAIVTLPGVQVSAGLPEIDVPALLHSLTDPAALLSAVDVAQLLQSAQLSVAVSTIDIGALTRSIAEARVPLDELAHVSVSVAAGLPGAIAGVGTVTAGIGLGTPATTTPPSPSPPMAAPTTPPPSPVPEPVATPSVDPPPATTVPPRAPSATSAPTPAPTTAAPAPTTAPSLLAPLTTRVCAVSLIKPVCDLLP